MPESVIYSETCKDILDWNVLALVLYDFLLHSYSSMCSNNSILGSRLLIPKILILLSGRIFPAFFSVVLLSEYFRVVKQFPIVFNSE